MIDHIKTVLQVFPRPIWNQDVLDRRRHPVGDQGQPKPTSERTRPEMTK